MEIVYVYQKKRRDFGRQSLFSDRPVEEDVGVLPDPQYESNYTVRNPISVEVQAVPEMSEHDANTDSFVVLSKGIQHLEGGWPKDVDCSDVEHTLRYRRKVEKDEEYVRQVKQLEETVSACIKQNIAIDIYGEFFQDNQEDIHEPSAKTLNVCRDPMRRPATSLSWYPEEGRKIAVACSVLEFQKTPLEMVVDSYIWDIENPNQPDQVLVPQSPLVCIKYNPKDPHVLVGGSCSGIVSCWDTRKGSIPSDCSSIDKSHRDPVYSVQWVQSKTGSEFFSTSTDGMVLWWDIRKLSEPTETLVIDPEKNQRVTGGTVLDFESTMPTKFMVGTESGLITMCNKKAKTPADRIASSYQGHVGPVRALQRNPFSLKNFLTVGDWTAKIWSEDVKTSLMQTRMHESYVTDGCWSPVRASVFFTSTATGKIKVWDCTCKLNAPVFIIQVSSSPIMCVRAQEQGRLVAASSKDGAMTVLEVSDALGKPYTGEKLLFGQMIERETKREKALESIAREKRLKANQPKRPSSGRQSSDLELSGDALESAEKDFFECQMK